MSNRSSNFRLLTPQSLNHPLKKMYNLISVIHNVLREYTLYGFEQCPITNCNMY